MKHDIPSDLSSRIIILGAGGHSRVLIDLMKKSGIKPEGILDKTAQNIGKDVMGVSILGTEREYLKEKVPELVLVNGIGSVNIKGIKIRKDIFLYYKNAGYRFLQLIHPSAILADNLSVSEGVQIMAGVIIQTGTEIKENTVINTGAKIDHDCHIGAHSHIAPGVTMSGAVTVGSSCHIGTGAIIIQGITIGENSLVAAGSVVIRDVPDNSVVMGIPAKNVTKKMPL